MEILEAAYASDIRTFRFTGGEPTQRRNVGEIVSRAQAMGDDVRVSMTTNGVHLDRLVDVFRDLVEPRVFLSVDGISDSSTVSEDSSEFRIEKWLTPRIMDLISVFRPIAAVRLNFVLTASTAPQLPMLIDYASEHAIDIKIFELLLRDFYYSGHRPQLDVFREQYVSVRSLLPALRDRYGEPTRFAGTGGRGIPMQAFNTGSSRVIFFDSSIGSHYGDVCHACPHFPCQEGLYAPVLDANGTLHPAGCVNPLLYTRLAISSGENLLNAFRGLQAVIRGASLERVLPDAIRAEAGRP